MSTQRPLKASGAPSATTGSKTRGGILQRKCDCGQPTPGGATCRRCRSQALQRKAGPSAGGESEAPALVHTVLGRSGRPLEPTLQRWMGYRFQHDFSGVRLHTDREAASSAQAVGALAYTVGQHVVFNEGGYAPHRPEGLHLLAHELTHVVQQSRHPLPMGEGLQVEPETSAAEAEADRMASTVISPGAAMGSPSARPRGLSRGLGWALLGGAIGAVAGGLLGALAGPIGAAIGAAAGAAVGAWIGGSASNSKKDDKEGTRRQRIHRLLSTGFTDWVVTDEEALQALEILREAEKADPLELFDIVMMMRLAGEWQTLLKELPPSAQPAWYYFEQFACHPDRGYVMPGDTLHLNFFIPGRALPSKEKGKDTSYEARVSGDYDVTDKGIRLPDMGEVPVAGLSLQDAATRIAEAYTDPLWAYEMGVDLTPVKRGYKYSGMGQVASPEKVTGFAKTKDKAALAHRDKRSKFADLVPWSLATAGRRMELAVLLYYDEVDKRLDQHEDPQVLWKWAQEQADKRIAEWDKKTPVQEFLAFGQQMMARVSTMPKDEQARTQEAYNRYIAWLSKHDQDPKLATYKPVDIWVKAYVNIVSEEVEKSVHKAMDDLKAKRREEAWKKAEVKFGEAIEFAKANIWPEQRARSISSNVETISETTGEVIKKGWLITASPAEKIIRDKIASDFLHSVLERMQKDPEAFNKTSVKVDFYDYLRANPEQLTALQLTVSRPNVERIDEKVDIPAWQTAAEIVVGFIPFVGTAVALGEAISGEDLFGHPLTTTERVIVGVGALLPGIFKTLKLGKEAFAASKVVQAYGLEGAEAARVYKIYTGLGPGTTGAKLFDWGFREIKAGRAIDDPKVLQQMEAVLKDLGMTEKETAKALMPAVQRQAETVAKEEVRAVKAIVGPVSDETEQMLMKNTGLREALKENSLAAKVLKKCNTPCIPEQATADQVRRLEGYLEQIRKTGPYDEEALRLYLYNHRAELDKAIREVGMAAESKNIRDGSAAKSLDARMNYFNGGGKITRGIDQAAAQVQREASEALGVAGGRKQAGLDGLSLSNFKTPLVGDQGFDDIALKGTNWDKDIIYILEHKGESARLSPGQMDLDWVVKNIQRLYREGGTEGQMWAQRLAKAAEEGRLRGRGYSTKTVGGATETTLLNDGKDWIYKAKVALAL